MNLYSENATPNDAIDYDKIEECFYNALSDYYSDNQVVSSSDSDIVVFGTDTDATMLTGSVAAAPTSSEQQATMYLLDLRNISFLFLITYFLITIYSKLKNTIQNYYKE